MIKRKIRSYSIFMVVFVISSGLIFVGNLGISELNSIWITKAWSDNENAFLQKTENEITQLPSLDNITEILGKISSNLSYIQYIILVILIILAVGTVIVGIMYRKYDYAEHVIQINETRLGIILTMFVAISVAFATSADVVTTTRDQTVSQLLSTLLITDGKHKDSVIMVLNDFLQNNAQKYYENIIDATFFGVTSLLMLFVLLIQRIMKPNIFTTLIVYGTIISIVMWAILYFGSIGIKDSIFNPDTGIPKLYH